MQPSSFLQRLPTHERVLDNGLTVIVREDHSAPVVAIVTHVKAGYFDEPDELVGISHVLEHMYFKGTARRGAGAIARETKEAGGYLNAGTIYDRTSYYTVLPSASLEQALDIQSDALQRSAIDDDELRRELLVIVQEARRKLDNPTAVAQETLFETMFDVHRIRRWRIGTEAVLQSFSRQHVWDYYRNLYRASNTIVVIAGDVDPEHAFDRAAHYYSDMPAGEPLRSESDAEPDRRGFRYREMTGDIGQSYVEWGWRTPGTLHEDTPALDLLAIALGQGRASRLYRNVREAGAVAGISAYNYTPTTVGIFGIGAELDSADTERAFHGIADTVRDVVANGFTDAEAERARNILEARMLRRMETAEGQANLIAEWQAHGSWKLADDYLRALLAVTAEQLGDVAQRYLQPDRLTALLYRPRTAPQFAAEPEELWESLWGRAAAPAAADGNRMRPAAEEDGVRFYDVGEGGARIVIRQRTTAPLVSIGVYCRGGVLAEGDGTVGLTGLMSRTSVKGTRSRTAAQLAEQTEALGAGIAPGVSADMIDWSISVPSRHFAQGLDLLLDAALEPVFPAGDAERERKNAISGLEQLRDNMHQYPLRLVLSEAFPGHAYGVGVDLLENSLRNADLGSLQQWHDDRVLAGAPHIFVVGDVPDPDRTAAGIARLLRGRLREPLAVSHDPPAWGTGGSLRVETRDKAQSGLALAFPGPARGHDDIYALQVLSAAIAGLGGRLFEELRSRRSLAYSVSASPIARWLGGAFVAYIGMSPEREQEAREALLRELLATTAEPLDGEEVDRARQYLIGTWQIRQQTHARQLADLAHAVLLGDGLAELRDFEGRIRAVDAEAVRAAAERWLQPDQLVEAVVRGTGGGR